MSVATDEEEMVGGLAAGRGVAVVAVQGMVAAAAAMVTLVAVVFAACGEIVGADVR